MWLASDFSLPQFLLDGIIVTAVVVIVLALIDRPIEQAIRTAFRWAK